MPSYTKLNLEQSIAKYLADQFVALGYSVYWRDSKQTQGTGERVVTLVRSFPVEQTAFVGQASETTSEGHIKVPAFSVAVELGSTRPQDRMGLGESVFEWSAGARIDGFADNEFEWYKLSSSFRNWFGSPDIRVPVYDYESDLTNESPSELEHPIMFGSALFFTDKNPALQPPVRYYLNCQATINFIE